MMEFFISKFWAFLVSLAIMGVLVQAVQMDVGSDRGEALTDVANHLERLFGEFATAGAGLETTVYLEGMLPATSALTVLRGYAILKDGVHEVRFILPDFRILIENEHGDMNEADRLVLDQNDSIRLINHSEGSTMISLSR